MKHDAEELRRRLVGVAAALDLPGLGPRVEDAVTLALDLVVAGLDTPATVAVASLGKGATLRDAGDDIRLMLREQGTFPPRLPGIDDSYSSALWAVALGGISVGEFSVVFYNHVLPWDEQDADQRALVVLLHDWEQESDPLVRQPITESIRAAAAVAVGLDPR